jgi:VanZ family protein
MNWSLLESDVWGYGGQALVLEFLSEKGRGARGLAPPTIGAVLAIGYGLLIEIYQGILPWRTFGLDDLFWNTVGVLFVLALVGVLRGARAFHLKT